ncbi:MAG: HepT-like ribonuclease domain-containing protein [Candidatus Omnitrophota bacterium]
MYPEIEQLKDYFNNQPDVLMAFVFGSRARGKVGPMSDWDIGVYFRPLRSGVEWEEWGREYPLEDKVWEDCIGILRADDVDLVVLNRCPAGIAADAIEGAPLVIKDRGVFTRFMLIVTGEAADFRQTAAEYSQVYWRSFSLNAKDKDILNRRLIFLDSELRDISVFRNLDWQIYQKEHSRRRDVERWIENIMNAAIDIAKTALASCHRPVPANYREILAGLVVLPGFPVDLARQLAEWAKLRNILAHEYLDIRWERIKVFIDKAEPCFRRFIPEIRRMLAG